MKTIRSSVFAFIFSVLFSLGTLAAPSAVSSVKGVEEIEGNIFYVSLMFENCTDIFGGQGIVTFDNAYLELLEFVPELPEGYRFRYDDNGTGKVTYLFYRTDSNAPAITGSAALFNLYFQINVKPENDRVFLKHAECQLFDLRTHVTLAPSEYSAGIKDYTPPVSTVTTAPPPPVTTSPVTKPPITTTTPTQPITTEAPPTDPVTTEPISQSTPTESIAESDTVPDNITDPVTTSAIGSSVDSSSYVFVVISVAVLCAVVSGTAVYFIMKKKQQAQ